MGDKEGSRERNASCQGIADARGKNVQICMHRQQSGELTKRVQFGANNRPLAWWLEHHACPRHPGEESNEANEPQRALTLHNAAEDRILIACCAAQRCQKPICISNRMSTVIALMICTLVCKFR